LKEFKRFFDPHSLMTCVEVISEYILLEEMDGTTLEGLEGASKAIQELWSLSLHDSVDMDIQMLQRVHQVIIYSLTLGLSQ
jgi:hypothetical protein